MPLDPPMTCTDLSLTKHSEGCVLHTYSDPAGQNVTFSMGWGTQRPEFKPGMTCTQQEADQWLAEAMQERVDYLNRVLNVRPTQDIFNALCDAAYNIIPSEFHASTLMRKAEAGDWDGAWLELPKWRLADGQVDEDLLKRRRLEQAVWLGMDWLGMDWRAYYAECEGKPWWPANFSDPGAS